ncbi:putative quorum-sensing-regulated virulence factor [Paenalcaligenes hermetiae]|uniref:DUF3820 family protein n=1 Tax=Paenalcaligenes hermetiae TaxID=1157987 RepID=A0ABP9M802_9BURK
MSAYIFDTETTGTEQPDIIEAAWLEIDAPTSLQVVSQFEQRYQPRHPISLGALAVHHIYDEELVNCPPCTTFQFPAQAQYMIGHNVDYDWEMAGRPNVKRICTLALSRMLLPQLDSHSQSALMYYFFRPHARERLKNAHSALADVQNCRFILQKMLALLEQPVQTWEQLWELSEQARLPRVMPFGKHKGTPISELPPDYQDWVLRQDSMDPYIKLAIQKARQALHQPPITTNAQ